MLEIVNPPGWNHICSALTSGKFSLSFLGEHREVPPCPPLHLSHPWEGTRAGPPLIVSGQLCLTDLAGIGAHWGMCLLESCRPLNNMGLNCMALLTRDFFSIVNTTALHGQWSHGDGGPTHKFSVNFQLVEGGRSEPPHCLRVSIS